jgi:hypothetical protein
MLFGCPQQGFARFSRRLHEQIDEPFTLLGRQDGHFLIADVWSARSIVAIVMNEARRMPSRSAACCHRCLIDGAMRRSTRSVRVESRLARCVSRPGSRFSVVAMTFISCSAAIVGTARVYGKKTVHIKAE